MTRVKSNIVYSHESCTVLLFLFVNCLLIILCKDNHFSKNRTLYKLAVRNLQETSKLHKNNSDLLPLDISKVCYASIMEYRY